MQDNLKLIIWTVAGLIAVWFIAVTVNRNIYLHTDVDRSMIGTIPMNLTDIGDQCGEDNANGNELIEYKMNMSGQIVYLCPQGVWPIQKVVVAGSISNEFKARISPLLRDKINKYYPGAGGQTTPAAMPSTPPASDQPDLRPVAPKGLFSPPAARTAPQPVNPPPAAKTTQPQEPVNPFIGNGGNPPAAPAQTAPAPAQPVPVQPVPVQPVPVQPVPVQPAPVQPVPVQPAPVQPVPVQPAPVQ